jgi:hypothetical protein
MNPDGGVPFLAEKDVWISALAGRTLSELAPARGPVPRIGEFVADRQLPDGGWGFCRDTAQQAEAEDPAFAAKPRKRGSTRIQSEAPLSTGSPGRPQARSCRRAT